MSTLLDEGVLDHISIGLIDTSGSELTLGPFLDPAPAFDWGNGAGAAFFPALGGYH
jgi:hypothetical protein